MTLSRAPVVAALATAFVLALNPPVTANATPVAGEAASLAADDNGRPGTLGALAKANHLLIGTAVDMSALANDTTYKDRIALEFSSVTAENVMKWETVEPQPGHPDYTQADALVDFARENHQQVRGHTLLWHNQLPKWLTDGVADGSIPPDQLRQILRRHIFEVVGHFRGKVYQWDVANEVIDDSGNLRETLWLQQLGPGYLADAFRWAHEADPRVKLYLNDYNVEGISAKSTAYVELIKRLQADRVPVDGMGIQGHLGVQYGFYPATAVAANMQRFLDLGLEVSVTEADVRMILPVDNAKLQAQAQGYSTLLTGCLLVRRCTSFTVWGFTDRYSWVPGFFDGQGAANLLDENFQAKPAYEEMRAILSLRKD
jgi:endo-1,4-beta-xylanase